MSQLALLGGPKTVTQPPPHFRWPPLTRKTQRAVLEQLRTAISIDDRSGIIAQLEDALCAYYGVRHALLFGSRSAALHAMYAAAGLEPGDEVIVPTYASVATVGPLLHLGAVPVLADCDNEGQVDPQAVADLVTSKTCAVVLTHTWGIPGPVKALEVLAERHDLLILEDGFHAHGTRLQSRLAGRFGDAAAFSMGGQQTLSAGEGGFLLTDRDDVFRRALIHGHHGTRCLTELPRHHPLYAMAESGMGLRNCIHPLAASIGLEQLANLDSYMEGRHQIAAQLCEQLSTVPGLTLPDLAPGSQPSWQALPLRYDPNELGGLPLERFLAALQAEGCVEVQRPTSPQPLHLLPLLQDPAALFPSYRNVFHYEPGDFPRAEALHQSLLTVPVGHRDADMEWAEAYATAFWKVAEHHRDLLRQP